MAVRRITTSTTLDSLLPAFERIRTSAGVPAEFPAAVSQEATLVAQAGELDHVAGTRADMTDIDFVTIDPEGSRDLDQAVFLGRVGGRWRVRYAIADVAAHVRPGGAVDRDTRSRVETVYCPDLRVGLHPPVMSEGFASLLPGQRTKAVVWTIDLGDDGGIESIDLTRAWVRSRSQYSYVELAMKPPVEARQLVLDLHALGEARRALARTRDAVSLPKPSQEVSIQGDHLVLEFKAGLGIEDDNAQVSLLTGEAAASLMLDAGLGILRTMPAASESSIERLRRQALAIGVQWAPGAKYAEVLKSVDPQSPAGAAFLAAAVGLFRGAQWTPFDVRDGSELPEPLTHGALGVPYAHVTAPLRRLVDRFGTEVCLAHVAGEATPEWVMDALPELGEVMAGGVRRSARVDRECLDVVESAVLAPHVGEAFEAVGLDHDTVQLTNPAVVARCSGEVTVGQWQRVRLVAAPADAGPRFEVIGPSESANEGGGES